MNVLYSVRSNVNMTESSHKQVYRCEALMLHEEMARYPVKGPGRGPVAR